MKHYMIGMRALTIAAAAVHTTPQRLRSRFQRVSKVLLPALKPHCLVSPSRYSRQIHLIWRSKSYWIVTVRSLYHRTVENNIWTITSSVRPHMDVDSFISLPLCLLFVISLLKQPRMLWNPEFGACRWRNIAVYSHPWCIAGMLVLE